MVCTHTKSHAGVSRIYFNIFVQRLITTISFLCKSVALRFVTQRGRNVKVAGLRRWSVRLLYDPTFTTEMTSNGFHRAMLIIVRTRGKLSAS